MSGGELETARGLPAATTDEAREWRRRARQGVTYVPDFVMVGVPKPDGGVMLFASTTLTEAQLKKRVLGIKAIPITDRPNGPVARVPDERTLIVAEMHDFTLIHAASYPSAIATLQELWTRNSMPTSALMPGEVDAERWREEDDRGGPHP